MKGLDVEIRGQIERENNIISKYFLKFLSYNKYFIPANIIADAIHCRNPLNVE